MLCFTDINWAEASTSTDDAIAHCMRNNVPIFFKVRRDSQLVYRYHHVQLENDLGIASLPSMGIDDELVFMRLDSVPLADIAVSKSSTKILFTGEGFSIPQPYRVIGHTLPARRVMGKYEDITSPILEKVEFYKAFILNKEKWDLSASKLTVSDQEALKQCRDSFKIEVSDLYFTFTDISMLKEKAQKSRELAPYPYEHRERMPGIYWMFQAAYAQNELKILPKEKVRDWLVENADKGTYGHRSVRTAKKFVQLKLDRAKGTRGRGDFDLEDLERWDERGKFEFPFVSKGLSFILAIADWWLEMIKVKPDETNLSLATRLADSKFRGGEIDDLVYLISGRPLTKEGNT